MSEARNAAREILREFKSVCGPAIVNEGHGYGGNTAEDAGVIVQEPSPSE